MPQPRLTFLAGLALAVAPVVAVAAAEPSVQVTEVVIEGTRKVAEERVRFLLNVRSGRAYTRGELQEAIADDVRAIETMGPFSGVRAELRDDGRSVAVVYRMRELPYVSRVEIEGLDYFDEEKAEKAITTRVGSHLKDVLIENDRRAIERVFQERGDRACRVRVETTEDRGSTVVTFVVTQGSTVKVALVNYVGLPDGARPMVMDRALLMPRGSPYQPELVSIDEGAVVRALHDQGWLDARLVETRRELYDYVRTTEERRRHGPEIVPDAAYNDRVVLTYVVDAGARYRLGKVSFVGNEAATQEQLREAFAMPEGAWFKRDDLEGQRRPGGDKGAIEHSRRVISNQGYARCELHQDRRLDLERHIVDLVLHVREGRKYRIGRVDVHGNEHTRDAVVRRAMFLHPGDRWNDDRRDESLDQVRRTGVFKSGLPRPVSIEPAFPEDRPDEADLVVAVDEDATGSLNFQLGYSTATKVFGTLGYTERNFDLLGVLTGGFSQFRGASQILEFQLTWSQPAKSLSTTWTNPHVMDGPYSLSVTGSRVDSSLRQWRERRMSGGATVGRYFLNNRLNVGLSYGYTDLKVTRVTLNAPDDALAGNYFLQTLSLGEGYDRLSPDRNTPTSGYNITANQSVTGGLLDSSSEYWEYGFKGDGFLPLATFEDGGVTYFHLSGRWREQYPIGSSRTVPFYQRYRDGGQAPRHRGFEYDDLSPQQINKNGFLSRPGGTRNAMSTLELSVPVQGTNEGIRAIAFVDVGNVWAQEAALSWRDLRTAVGVGVRFPIQIPVALDFAWLINPGYNESRTNVQFGLGNVRF